MNTWRDIKTAPKHQPVLVTVEGMICFGRFCDFEDEDYSGLAFDGACLNDGESVSYFADYIDGWQPAPATFQPEQDFRERTERIISEIQGMMGEKMYYGEMVGAPAPYCHEGPLVYEYPEDYSLEKAVNVLEKMLEGDYESLEPEKTADEMFRELGYEPIPNPALVESYYAFAKDNGEEILFREDGVIEFLYDNDTSAAYPEDILACAQLIKEMEANNG